MVLLGTVFSCSLLLLLEMSRGHPQSGPPIIYKEPETSYILTGQNANFSCETTSHEAYWIINGGDLLGEHRWSDFGPEYDFSKAVNDDQHSYNLSLIILGTSNTNLTTVACSCYDDQSNSAHSGTATLYVFDAFIPPPAPHILIDLTNETLQISSPYIWADYEKSSYNISLMTASDFSSHQIATVDIPSLIPLNNFYLLSSLVQPCSKYVLFVTTVSPVFGSSMQAQLEFITPRGRASIPEVILLNTTVYFNSYGAPFLSVFATLSGTCPQLNYTYSIHIRAPESQPAIDIGPKLVDSAGLINEMLIGDLEANLQYRVQLEVNFSYYTDERSIVYVRTLETSINHQSFCGSTVVDGLNRDITSSTEYVAVTLGVLCAVLAILLVIVTVVCICCSWRLRKTSHRQNQRSSSNAMITNPIYSGPVYETVHQGYNPLSSSASTTPDSSPTTPLNDDVSRYNINPTSRTDIVDLVRRNTLPNPPNGRIVSPLAGTSYRSSSISGNTTVKPPPRERNKLHLTLSLGKKIECSQNEVEIAPSSRKNVSGNVGPISEDENYTIMSPAANRRFGSSNNGGWGEVSPELTSKYQE